MKINNFINYEIIKVISEQLRSASWGLAGVFTYFGWTSYKFLSGLAVFILWLFLQGFSLALINSGQKLIRQEEEDKC